MSIPENPLTRFSSYSYYQSLIVCSNSKVAEALSQVSSADSELNRYTRPPGLTNRYNPIKSPETGGNYVIIIDGRHDANFVITGAYWSTNILPMPDRDSGVERYTAVAVEGSMEVLEPIGAGRFYQAIIHAMDALKTDPSGAVFLLKTFFVGHTPEGHTEFIANVRPIIFIMYDIEANFNNAASQYKINFIALSNGAGKMPQANLVMDTVNSFKPTSKKLAEVFKEFGTLIEKSYKEFRAKLDKDAKSSKPNKIISGRDVKYTFIVDAAYSGDNYILDASLPTAQDSCTGDVIFNFNNNGGVENAIDTIMKSCKGVLEDCNANPTGRYMYKITSTVDSTDDYLNYVYRINRHKIPTSKLNDLVNHKSIKEGDGSVITFDYYYTGKNTDILEFDMKMAMGLAFLQTLTSSNSVNVKSVSGIGRKVTNENSTLSNEGGGRQPSEAGQIRDQAVIYFPKKDTGPTRNAASPDKALNFQNMLNRFSAVEKLEAKLKIVGNTTLLNDMSPAPSHMRDGIPNQTPSVANKWDTTPFLAKINIRMPSFDVESGNVPDNSYEKFEDFWFKGYYMIIGVDNHFQDGEFTQELDMISLPTEPVTGA